MMFLSPLSGQRLRLPLAVAACSVQSKVSVYKRSMCLDIIKFQRLQCLTYGHLRRSCALIVMVSVGGSAW